MRALSRCLLAVLPLLFPAPALAAADVPDAWERAFPETDFSTRSVPLDQIIRGGPGRDGIPAIDDPRAVPLDEAGDLPDREPVIGVVIDGEARAYPLRILMWHEIANDTLGGVPIAVTFCPLCNSGIVFDRRVEGRRLDFGVSGLLRFSDMVMYDRQTESWWQQFLGQGIVGHYTGTLLEMVPSRMESFGQFRRRAPQGTVMVPRDPDFRRYGVNPYAGYDTAGEPFLYRGPLPEGVAPLERVVVVGDEAWPLALVRDQGPIRRDGLVIEWHPGMASALDTADIAGGREIGSVTVQRDGRDVVHDLSFAFAFTAFRPDGTLHGE